VRVDAPAIPMSVDGDRLQQVVWNLVSNAVKFTPRGGHVDVVVERLADEVAISVRDDGAGIAREFLPHVFERFRQGESRPTREHGGLGLGLSIAKHLVEMHGGTIRVASDGVGKGATFRVLLPCREHTEGV
jgi:signal transduction histidine kinase